MLEIDHLLRKVGTRRFWIFLILWAHIACISAQEITDSTSYDVLIEVVNRLRRGPATPQLADALAAVAVRNLARTPNADEAIKGYLEAIQTYSELSDIDRQIELKTHLAFLYIAKHYRLEALNLLQEAARHALRRQDTAQAAIIHNFIGGVHLALDSVETGMSHIRHARTVADSSDAVLLERLSTTTIRAMQRGGVRLNISPDSTEIIDRPSNIAPDYYSLALLNSGQYHLHHQRWIEAEFFLQRLLDTTSFDGELIRDAYQLLAVLHEQQGDMDQAFMYLKKYSRLNDSLLNDRRQRIINELLIQHNTFEQQARIRDLEKDKNIATINSRLQKILTFSLLFGSVIVLLGAYLTIRNYQQRLNTNQIIHKQNEEINQSRITELENNLKIETMQSMILGQEAERERIAKDLHDSLGGLLSTVKLHFDAVQAQRPEVQETKEYVKAHQLLDEACKEVRNISNNMQPGALLRMGVVPAISDLINRLQSDATAQIDFQHYGLNGDLDQTTALNIFRIVQELLNNSLKHAQAKQILVQLVQKDDELMVTVEDDGVGYDSHAVKKGMGTENIASRVNFLKGDLSIHSVIGEGTSTLVNIPLS